MCQASGFCPCCFIGSFWCCPLPHLILPALCINFAPKSALNFGIEQSKSWVPHCQENRADLVTTQPLNGVAGAFDLDASFNNLASCWHQVLIPPAVQTDLVKGKGAALIHCQTVTSSRMFASLTWSKFMGVFHCRWGFFIVMLNC